MSTFKVAFDLTARTIDRRARAYRNLVVLISVIGISTITWAGIARSGRPLLLLFLLVPLCAGFFALDSFLVNRWRVQLLRLWIDDDLDLNHLASSLAAIQILPAGTVRAMLASLPIDKQTPGTAELSQSMKQALAATAAAIHGAQTDLTILAALSYLLAVICLVWAVIAWTWLPLLGCLVIAAVRLAARVFLAWRVRQRLHPHSAHWQAEGIDLDAVAALSGIAIRSPRYRDIVPHGAD
jgi:hypothetical protein